MLLPSKQKVKQAVSYRKTVVDIVDSRRFVKLARGKLEDRINVQTDRGLV